jgi:hypothetical protein
VYLPKRLETSIFVYDSTNWLRITSLPGTPANDGVELLAFDAALGNITVCASETKLHTNNYSQLVS